MEARPVTSRLPGLRQRLPQVTGILRLGRQRVVAFTRRHPVATPIGVGSAALGLAVAITSFALQSHFANAYQAGQRLAGWQNYLRLGAPWQALVPVGLAGLLASWGALRLGSAQPEPPVGLGAPEVASAGQLRAALRTERRVVRIAFAVMTGLVGMVLVRFVLYAALAVTGNGLARSTLVGVALELALWLVAWVAFWAWNRRHRQRLESWGVFET